MVTGKNPRQWNDWFAWHPVKCEGSWVWLELIERCMVVDTWSDEVYYDYRFKDPLNPFLAVV